MLLWSEDFVRDFSRVVLGAGVGIPLDDDAPEFVIVLPPLVLLTLYTLSLFLSESSEHSVDEVQSLVELAVFLFMWSLQVSFDLLVWFQFWYVGDCSLEPEEDPEPFLKGKDTLFRSGIWQKCPKLRKWIGIHYQTFHYLIYSFVCPLPLISFLVSGGFFYWSYPMLLLFTWTLGVVIGKMSKQTNWFENDYLSLVEVCD